MIVMTVGGVFGTRKLPRTGFLSVKKIRSVKKTLIFLLKV